MATMKEIKDLGWSYIGLAKKSFKGAVQEYTTEDGKKVAVGFTLNHAYIVEDAVGLFEVNDIREGVVGLIKNHPSEVEGASILASNGGTEVEFHEDVLTRLGLNDFETRESLKNRILSLSTLDEYIDMPV